MRDIALTVFIFGMIPVILMRPWVGVLMWTWIGIMNPHRLTWGFAYDMAFAQFVAIATLVGVLLSREPKRFPATPETITLLVLFGWMTFTTMFALFPDLAWEQWRKVFKIQAGIVLTLIMMQERRRIELLVWVAALSVAFYGVKGGRFTVAIGGTGTVIGPAGSYIAGNTEISLAITMVIPLMIYLIQSSSKRWVRWALWISIALCAIAVVGSYSRGGVLAIIAMAAFVWLKSRGKRLVIGMWLALLVPFILAFMPGKWFERMYTIGTYQEDDSAMGRINAWKFAINLTKDRPLTGGGFEAFQPDSFQKWAPDPNDYHDVHSIWFEILGEHGYVGLLIYLVLWILAWRLASRLIRIGHEREDLRWAANLAAMIQVSFVGFWVGGSFLGLAYWDVPYLLIAVLVLTDIVVRRELAGRNAAAPQAGALRAVPSSVQRSTLDRSR